MTFFDDTIKHASWSESPREFLPWIPICTVSSILKANVHVDRQVYKIYPNVYVLIMGPSGIIKGYPVSVTKQLTKLVDNTRIISGRFTIQSLINKLSKMEERENGNHIKDASAAIISGEFSASVVDDPMAFTILTDLYDTDYNDVWVNSLKSSGEEVLKNPCITIMGASNEEHFNAIMTGREIRGGMIGRCILIYSKNPGPKNDFFDKIEGLDSNLIRFKPFLLDVAKLRGEMHIDDSAKVEYRKWHDPFEPWKLDDKTGGISRLKDKIWKISTCISIAKRCEKRITGDDIEHAITLCVESQVKLDKLVKGAGISSDSGKIRLVMQILIEAGGEWVSRSTILQRLTGDIDYIDLEKIITTFVHAEAVEVQIKGSNYWYRMRQEMINALEKKLGGGLRK